MHYSVSGTVSLAKMDLSKSEIKYSCSHNTFGRLVKTFVFKVHYFSSAEQIIPTVKQIHSSLYELDLLLRINPKRIPVFKM